MLLLKHLYLQNFMSIDELDLDFDDNEVIAICGQNGSGKSTLLYAIAYLLAGFRKGESYRDYVKAGCDTAKLYLEAYFKGEPLYCEAELTSNAKKGIAMPTKRKTVYKGITYLNSDHNQFIKENELDYMESLIFFFQDSGRNIIDARPSDRAATLKKLFKFEFTDIIEKLKNESEQNKFSKIETAAVIDEIKKRSFETQKLSREVLDSVINSWDEELISINSSLKDISSIDKASLERVQESINTNEKNIESLEAKKKEDNKNIKELEESLDIKRESLEDLKVNEKDLDTLKKDLEAHKEYYSSLKSKAEVIDREINISDFEKKELLKQIEISKKGVCHSCGQAITQDHIDSLLKREKEVNEKIASLNKDYEDLHFDKNDEKQKILEKGIREGEEVLRKENTLTWEISSLEKRIKELNRLQSERDTLENELILKRSSLNEEKTKYENLLPLFQKKEELEKEAKNLEEKIRKAKEDKIRNEEKKKMNNSILQEKKACEDKLISLNEKLNKLLLDMESTKDVINVFENSFPSFLVLQATQRLENHINEVVQRIFPYMKVKLRMQRSGVTFLYTSQSSEEEWLPVSMASGAQKAVLSLAYRTSLAKLYGITCIMLDEVDASCTAANAEIIYKFIASLDCFPQLIFISHRPESLEAVKKVNPNTVVYTVEDGSYSLKE